LENLIERLVILSDNGVTDWMDLPANIRSFVSDKKNPQPTVGKDRIDLREATEQLQYRLMEEAMRLANGNKSAAAKMLGLKRTTLVAKLRKRSASAKNQMLQKLRHPDEALENFHSAFDFSKDG
jgi:DNA-binding NtrC family response regulator